MPEGQKTQLVDLAINDQRMARVMTALKARDHIGALAQPVHNLAFAFVAPLSAHDNHVGHASSSGFANRLSYSGPGAAGEQQIRAMGAK
jgi:hypothetical protein